MIIKDIYESTVGQFYDFMKDEVFYHGGHNQAFQRLQTEIQKTLMHGQDLTDGFIKMY
mgnify:CR=1 FL=1